MYKQFLVLIFFLIHLNSVAQDKELGKSEVKLEAKEADLGKSEIKLEAKERELGKSEAKLESKEEVNKKESKKDTLTTEYYKIFYLNGNIDTADTSLNIYKDYKFNFLRNDSFDLISFPNSGHTYNKLAYNFKDFKKPNVGARAKHYNYFEKEDIGYYNVPTPFTEIFAKSTFEQGQILDILVSINLSPQYNFTVAHKGYKSLGKYVSSRSRGNQFRFSSNFLSKNNLTNWRFHFTSQNIFNQENGGLTPDDIYFYEQAPDYFELDNSGNQIINDDGSYKMVYYDGYLDRSRLGTSLFSEGSLYSKRFYSEAEKVLIRDNKKKLNTLSINYQFTHEYKKLEYDDIYKSNMFGEKIGDQEISEQSRFIEQENKIIFSSELDKIGKFNIGYSLTNWSNNYKIKELENPDFSTYGLDIDQSHISIDWFNKISKYKIKLRYNKSLKEEFKSDYISLIINGEPIKNINFELSSSLIEKSPNFNFKLFRSSYTNYNWLNNDLKDQKISNLNLRLAYKELFVLTGDYNIIDNYTFFRETANILDAEIDTKRIAKVEQISDQIKYYSVKLFSKIDLGKFSLVNTSKYQIKEQEEVFGDLLTMNVPEWITRNTIMYSSDIFNRSLQIQTGITFNYFTKFYADYYNPLISEFVTQNYKEIGDFPRFDFFFNAKIQQTRVFIKVEHFNSSFTGYDFYSDPFNPFRDASVRFGLVWNFFS
jgi:hypothetical protein